MATDNAVGIYINGANMTDTRKALADRIDLALKFEGGISLDADDLRLIVAALRGEEADQHIGWLKLYLAEMRPGTWQDMRDYAERQLARLEKSL